MKAYLSLFLALVLVLSLLAGCGSSPEAYVPTGDGLSYGDEEVGPATQPEEETVQELTLVYDSDVTMNPYRCTDHTNRALFSLLYQGLFTVDRDYNVQPMLCDRYSLSQDMRTYTFYLDERATFSDGTRVTREDVLASLAEAKSQPYYSSRFTNVIQFGETDDGGITITLSSAHENFPLLLDVPIVKAEDIAEEIPLGTGPYVLQDLGLGMQLTRRTNWWCSANMTVTAPIISLFEAESLTQIRDEFQFGALDLVQADPGSDKYADYLSDFELWDCDTGIFLYLVCNKNSDVFSTEELRAALTYAINRDDLVKSYYHGFASSATLPASPNSPMYNEALASRYQFDPSAFTEAVQNAGLAGREVSMIVNSEDTLRLRVANSIAEMLENSGLVVEISTYSGEDYYYVLNFYDYDLYLGQTKLSPNMDLSHFFAQNGNLSYGNLSDANLYSLCQQSLENHGNYYTLHQTIMDQGVLCPILFRSYAVFATRGLLTTLTPSRDTVFFYSIGKTMEQAYIRETS